ncbi:MAG: Para-hydroxybenzoate--polyprenyltransferase, mitochondrial precursor (PHB:polyprenyltransferase) [Bogoriella megaspora]|nr:MAG: Para-hydroxybenzoate--polyprenyltransferase, mitochondrial precursor (PHB:polyprenyltransferase) [Bogoriella megaspora]
MPRAEKRRTEEPLTQNRYFLMSLPPSWVPYTELARLHKPAGILYIYFPYLFGNLLVSCMKEVIPSAREVFSDNILLLTMAFLLRSVGCTWNDITDRDLDRQVARCCNRPLARRTLSVKAAHYFMTAQYLVLFAIAVVSRPDTIPFLVPVVITGTLYPYAKRVTNFAQVVLGLSLALGTPVGAVVAGFDARNFGSSKSSWALLSLTVSYVVWTVIYDTVYALQDVRDDSRAGIKAMSVRYEDRMKPLLAGLSTTFAGLFLSTGLLIDAGEVFFLGVGITTMLLFVMLGRIDLKSPSNCGWWFDRGSLFIGGSIAFSLGGQYVMRLRS